jgi:hypothetical protein
VVGETSGAFSDSTSNAGNSFQAAASFGTCTGSATPVWINGMEHGSVQTSQIFSTNTAGVADSTISHNGTGSLKVTKTAGTIGYIRKSIAGNQQVLHVAVRLPSLPAGDVTLAALDSLVGSDVSLKYQASTGKLALQWGVQAPVAATASFAAGTWYSIDIAADASASPLTASWQIDGVDQPGTTIAASTTTFQYLVFGAHVSEAPGYTAYYDDIFYSRTLGDYPVGDVRILALRPDSVGTHVNPGSFRNDDDTAIDANSWSRLDDLGIEGGTDWVKQVSAGSGDFLEFGFQNTTETCIRGVQAYASMGDLGSQGNTFKTSIFDGSTERLIYSGGSPCGNCTQPMNVLVTPAGLSWTASTLNGLVARIGYATAASPPAYWGQLMLEYAAK